MHQKSARMFPQTKVDPGKQYPEHVLLVFLRLQHGADAGGVSGDVSSFVGFGHFHPIPL